MSRFFKKVFPVFLIASLMFPFFTSCRSWLGSSELEDGLMLKDSFSPASAWIACRKKAELQSSFMELLPSKSVIGIVLLVNESKQEAVPIVKRAFLNMDVFKVKNVKTGELLTGKMSKLNYSILKTASSEEKFPKGNLITNKYMVTVSCYVEVPEFESCKYSREWNVVLRYFITSDGKIQIKEFDADNPEL